MLTTFVLLLTSVVSVHGHGYLQTPRSRNYVATNKVDGKDWNGGPTDPLVEYNAPGLNVVGPQCGQVGDRNYDFPNSTTGALLAPRIQANYTRGQTITVEVKVFAHHGGHFEFYACAITAGQSPSKACFQANPLEFVEDLLYGSPKDVNYPYRAYMAPPAISSPKDNMFSYRMKLPGNVVGNLVLIQWWWLSGNSCDYAGYEQYTWPASWGNMDPNLSKCIAPAYSGAEQFWNCAEVKIADISQPTTTPAPVKLTAAPVLATKQPTPTRAPMRPSTTVAPTVKRTPAPTFNVTIVKVGNFCGSSWANAGLKCSISCNDGNSTVCNAGEYCYAGVSCPVPNTVPTKAPASPGYITAAPVPAPSSVVTCGGGQRGNGICPQTGWCCSAWGYCGTGAQYCTRRNLHGYEDKE